MWMSLLCFQIVLKQRRPTSCCPNCPSRRIRRRLYRVSRKSQPLPPFKPVSSSESAPNQSCSTAQIKAQINKCQLLLSHPSDLFQIEASYFYNGQDILLLLHIPMAPADSILRLFQFHPFPLPFTKTHFLLPKPSKPIFALSSGMERLSAELSMVNHFQWKFIIIKL